MISHVGPRPPPSLYMWPADHMGVLHRVESPEGYWSCRGSSEECQSTSKVKLELECISLEPRAFVINNFFSDFEADWIIDIARPKLAGTLSTQHFSKNS